LPRTELIGAGAAVRRKPLGRVGAPSAALPAEPRCQASKRRRPTTRGSTRADARPGGQADDRSGERPQPATGPRQGGKNPPLSGHELWRTFIGAAPEAGADLAAVQQLAGHRSVTTSARYDRRPEKARRQAAKRVGIPYVARS
jgi:site-specific recombinase XerC